MVGFLFYILYVLIIVWGVSPFVFPAENCFHRTLLPLTFLPHFNVTCFLKIGLTVSFLELYVFLVLLCIAGCKMKIRFRVGDIDRMFFLLLGFSVLSLVISIFRIYLVGDLSPDMWLESNPFLRGLMSLNKLVFYPIAFLIIRNFLVERKIKLNPLFKKYTALAGILPMLAVFFQMTALPFSLYFNNPSFSTDLGWWVSPRPLGLTNEASFYSFQITFAIVAAYYCYKEALLDKRFCMVLIVLYCFSILGTLSRTGMLVVTIFFLFKFRKHISFVKLCLLCGVIFAVFNMNIAGFNMGSRFLSSFDVEADKSTIERYGSQQALAELAWDKSRIFGVGAFDYYFYIGQYLPSYYTQTITYAKDEPIPSFNFIIQMIAELGLVLFLLYIVLLYRLVVKTNSKFVQDWMLMLFIFALSFQVLNFSLPFTILLYLPAHDAQDSLCDRSAELVR